MDPENISEKSNSQVLEKKQSFSMKDNKIHPSGEYLKEVPSYGIEEPVNPIVAGDVVAQQDKIEGVTYDQSTPIIA